ELNRPEIWEGEIEFARSEELPFTAHVMEAAQIGRLKRRGMLGPDFLACHAIGASDQDMHDLCESNTPVCVATPALARAGHEGSPIVRLMQHGVTVCLSVDSTAGCDTADMFAVMRITMIFERMLHTNSGVYSTRDALRQATVEGARALGLGN